MKIAFRVDASLKIGAGHVMRCLTLADMFCLQGHQCVFICREHLGHLGEVIVRRGYPLNLLPLYISKESVGFTSHLSDYENSLCVTWQEDCCQTYKVLSSIQPDWLVVDHYALNSKWECRLTDVVENIMVIDDLANRSHYCKILLDQNLGRIASDYSELILPQTKLLIGTDFAVLRPEFAFSRKESLVRRQASHVNRILISLGGIDELNITMIVLKALTKSVLSAETEFVVIMGPTAPHLDDVKAFAVKMPYKTEVYCDVENMAVHMLNADLAIGAAGSTAWERCCLGLPTIQLILAENQAASAAALANIGAAVTLDHPDKIVSILHSLIFDLGAMGHLKSMSKAAASVTDGGGTSKVVDAVITLNESIL
jgi:UDP-2,4-diacetamido-2,4,6-trideoxy-beta-L-altropyranose hydrolase